VLYDYSRKWKGLRLLVKPNTEFNFNVAELEIVESAMKYRMGRLLARSKTVKKESSKVNIDAEVKHIYALLGKIHNQKNWYTPKGVFVSG
jgi:hypothetical protein